MAKIYGKSVSKSLITKATCAYIYKDGFVLIEEKVVGRGKYQKRVRIAHVFECETHMQKGVSIITIHDPQVLLCGLKGLRVYVNDKSQKMQEIGGVTDNVKIDWVTWAGAHFEFVQYSFVYCKVRASFTDKSNPVDAFSKPTGEQSALRWSKSDYIDFVEVH